MLNIYFSHSITPYIVYGKVESSTSKLPSRYTYLKFSEYAILKNFKKHIHSI